MSRCTDDLREVSRLLLPERPCSSDVCAEAADYVDKLEAENQRLREIETAAKRVVHTMRGSGGINPEGAKALRDLQALQEDEQ